MENEKELKDIFVVSSPYQVLSAFEARLYFGSTSNILIVSLPSDSDMISSRQICDVVERTAWDEVYFVYPQSSNKLYGVLKRWWILLRFMFLHNFNCHRFFIGDFRVQWKHYLRSVVRPDEVILIDDGSASVGVFNDYLSNGELYPKKDNALKEFFEKLLYFPFVLRRSSSDNFAVFTSYSFPETSDITIFHNDFSNLKSLFSSSEKSINNSLVWFIGSPYSEKGVLEYDYEVEFLATCIRWLEEKGLEVTYVAHRFDSCKKLAFIRRALGIKVKQLALPVEVYALSGEEVPGSVAAVYSSVLETLPKIVKFNEAYSFRLPHADSLEYISDIYSYYESIGITVVRV